MLIISSSLGITCFLLLFIIIVTIVSIINVMYKMVIKVYDVTNLSLSLRPDIDSSVSYLDDEKIKEIACFRVENGQLLQAVRNISHVNMELSEVR